MHVSEDSLDDILMELFKRFLNSSFTTVAATKGRSKEVFGALIELRNPRARLSRSELKGTIFSCIGELCWYLSGSDSLSQIQYYISRYDEFSDDKETVQGAYGPRLSKMHGQFDQIENIVALLQRKESSRRAVIQIFDAADLIADYKDVPCTTTLQFVIRNSKLDLMVHMRSNDIFLGLPHDVFCFTMLQELISNRLGVELGIYKHSVGSLHLYEKDYDKASSYISGGWQRQLPMPEMPTSRVEEELKMFLDEERSIRERGVGELQNDSVGQEYWKDLVRLLQAFSIYKTSKDLTQIQAIKNQLSENLFSIYLKKLEDRLGQP